MNWILPAGATLHFETLSSPVRVIRGLGGGGQGQVFEVEFSGDHLAVKWYFPACIAKDRGLEQRLSQSIRATSPNHSFLWPIALLRPSLDTLQQFSLPKQSFGYMMPLRPPEFVAANDHYGGHIAISLRTVLRACFELADAFHELHSKGLCYKDISIGNLFLDPLLGRVLICDNDNVDVNGRDLGSTVGTPGFMAPEVLLGKARPSSTSDLFSLANLIFRMLTRHDPLRGSLELQIRCLDEPARRRLYGEDPLFIFDEDDFRNRPDPIAHPAALLMWPIYPVQLQQLFIQTFGPGMKQPERRALTGQWKKALADTLDQRCLCPSCGQENFLPAGASSSCWACTAPLPASQRLWAKRGSVAAQPDNELHPHHFDPLASEQLDRAIARVQAHPTNRSVLGLKNLSSHTWTAELTNGELQLVEPGRSCNLSLIARIQTALGPIELQR